MTKAYRIIPPLTEKDLARFWLKVDRYGPVPEHRPELGPCWQWIAGKEAGGYAIFSVNGQTFKASRVSFLIKNKETSIQSLMVCHHCDNRLCVNHDGHLFLGTAIDNINDMVRKKRQALGDRNASRLYPGLRPSGDKHFSRISPEKLARGDKNGSRLHPEKLYRGEQCWASKLNSEQVIEILKKAKEGNINLSYLARQYNISRTSLVRIINRRTWKHVNF